MGVRPPYFRGRSPSITCVRDCAHIVCRFNGVESHPPRQVACLVREEIKTITEQKYCTSVVEWYHYFFARVSSNENLTPSAIRSVRQTGRSRQNGREKKKSDGRFESLKEEKKTTTIKSPAPRIRMTDCYEITIPTRTSKRKTVVQKLHKAVLKRNAPKYTSNTQKKTGIENPAKKQKSDSQHTHNFAANNHSGRFNTLCSPKLAPTRSLVAMLPTCVLRARLNTSTGPEFPQGDRKKRRLTLLTEGSRMSGGIAARVNFCFRPLR